MMLDAASSDLAAAVGVDVTAIAVITAANVPTMPVTILPPTSTAASLPLLLTMMQMTGGQ